MKKLIVNQKILANYDIISLLPMLQLELGIVFCSRKKCRAISIVLGWGLWYIGWRFYFEN